MTKDILDKDNIKLILKNIQDKLLNDSNTTFDLLAFKSKATTSESDEIIINYDVYKQPLKNKAFISSVNIILNYVINSVIDKSSLDHHNHNNAKYVLDIIENYVDNEFEYNLKYTHFVNSITGKSEKKSIEKRKSVLTHTSMIAQLGSSKLIIVSKANPIIGKKNLFYSFDDENSSLDLIDKKIFKIPIHPCLIIVNNLCILLNSQHVGTFLGIEDDLIRSSNEFISKVKSDNFINGVDIFERLSKEKKYYVHFDSLDYEFYNKLLDKSVHEELNKIGLKVENGKINIENASHYDLLIGYLTKNLQLADDGTYYFIDKKRQIKKE